MCAQHDTAKSVATALVAEWRDSVSVDITLLSGIMASVHVLIQEYLPKYEMLTRRKVCVSPKAYWSFVTVRGRCICLCVFGLCMCEQACVSECVCTGT